MTAYRIVTDHEELDNIGQLTHVELDAYVQTTGWIIVSGSSGPFPPSARRLAAGPGITISDGGPNNDLIISSNSATTGSQISWLQQPVGIVDGVNKQFTLTYVPVPSASLMFFINGVLQSQGPSCDYTVSGSTVTLITDYRSGSNIFVTYPF